MTRALADVLEFATQPPRPVQLWCALLEPEALRHAFQLEGTAVGVTCRSPGRVEIAVAECPQAIGVLAHLLAAAVADFYANSDQPVRTVAIYQVRGDVEWLDLEPETMEDFGPGIRRGGEILLADPVPRFYLALLRPKTPAMVQVGAREVSARAGETEGGLTLQAIAMMLRIRALAPPSGS